MGEKVFVKHIYILYGPKWKGSWFRAIFFLSRLGFDAVQSSFLSLVGSTLCWFGLHGLVLICLKEFDRYIETRFT